LRRNLKSVCSLLKNPKNGGKKEESRTRRKEGFHQDGKKRAEIGPACAGVIGRAGSTRSFSLLKKGSHKAHQKSGMPSFMSIELAALIARKKTKTAKKCESTTYKRPKKGRIRPLLGKDAVPGSVF
jgi:hypothetical protein